MLGHKLLSLLVGISLISYSAAFSPPTTLKRSASLYKIPLATSHSRDVCRFASPHTEDEESSSNAIWQPQLRRVLGSVATLGALETAYLTYNKLTGQVSTLCGIDGSCNDVLNGPYSYVPFTEIPLSAIGLLAYVSAAALALGPLMMDDPEHDDSGNRVALTAVATVMGTFSAFLMILLFGVLQTTCPYCVFSAACSISLAMLVWIGGCLPEGSKTGARTASTSFLMSTVVALMFFVSVGDSMADESLSSTLSGSSTTLLASNTNEVTKLYSPPTLTTESSERALTLAKSLQKLDAKMYGAYWCSHCFDQKETFGKQAFGKLTYVECAKDGVNSQYKLCKDSKVPGYPTWEIQGKLYPGEQELDELENIVKEIQAGTI
jgi:uncharacterized membrane protein